MRVFKPLALIAVTLLLPSSAFAQPSEPIRLTLDDAIARGIAASHRVRESSARHEAADAVVVQRQASQLPQVAAQAGYTRTNHVDEFGILLPNNQLRVIYPDVPDNYRTRLDVAWPVYTGGRLEAFEQAARRESTAAANDVEAQRGDVRLEIARAFWTLVVADESLRVLNESLARMSAHVGNVRNALAAGLVPPNDVLTAEAQESRQRMLSIQARAARDIAEAELAHQIGVAAGTAIAPEVSTTAEATLADAVALAAKATAERKDRRAIADRMAAADLRSAAALAGRRPTIAIGGGVDYGRPNPRIFPRAADWKSSWDASVNLNWSVFDGGRSRAEAAEASAGKRALQERLAELDAVVAVEIRQRLSEIDANRAALAAADAALRAATEALRVVNDRYGAGVAISTDVLDAQGLMLQASLDRTQAIAGQRIAEARLKRALGQ